MKMAEEEENVADIDFSQIRTSIQLGGRTVEQVLNGIHYGSPEVRLLLLDECDLILECRVCRGLFRALANFVAHKRVYCKQAYIMTQEDRFSNVPEDDVVVVEPVAPEEEEMEPSTSEPQSAENRVQDTISQINDGVLGKSQMYQLYSKAAEKVERQKKTKKTISAVLTKIASNSNAVKVSYQEVDEETACKMESQSISKTSKTISPREKSVSLEKTVQNEQQIKSAGNEKSASCLETILLSPQLGKKLNVLKSKSSSFMIVKTNSVPTDSPVLNSASLTKNSTELSCKASSSSKPASNFKLANAVNSSTPKSPIKSTTASKMSPTSKSASSILINSTTKANQCFSGKSNPSTHAKPSVNSASKHSPKVNPESPSKSSDSLENCVHMEGDKEDKFDEEDDVAYPLKCDQCDTVYSSRKSLGFHMQSRHSGQRTFFPCPYCTCVFFYIWGLTRHLQHYHKKSPLQINKMRKQLKDAAFTKHVTRNCVQAKEQLEFTIDGEEDKMDSSETTLDSQKGHSERTAVEFQRKEGSGSNQILHSKTISSPCPVLADSSIQATNKATIKHTPTTLKHTFSSRYVPIAEPKDSKTSALTSIESASKQYNHQLVCDKCNKVFWKKGRLTNHRQFCKIEKTVIAKTHMCYICNKKFQKEIHLERHMDYCRMRNQPAAQKGIEPVSASGVDVSSSFICEFCKRDFEKKVGLENHKRYCQKPIVDEIDKMAAAASGKGLELGRSQPKAISTPAEVNVLRLRTRSIRDMTEETSSGKLLEQDNTSEGTDVKLVPKESMSNSDLAVVKLRTKNGKFISVKKMLNIVQREKIAREKVITEGSPAPLARTRGMRNELTEEEVLVGDEVHVVEEIWVRKQPGRPSEKVKSNRIYVMEAEGAGRLHCQDTKKLAAMVDEGDLKCMKCSQEFTSVSNLRRHAIRHLGWKRYKCKLCRFSSYNKSECNTHIVRTHSEKYRFTSAETLIVDLNKEASRIRNKRKQDTMTENRLTLEKTSQAEKRTKKLQPEVDVKKSKKDSPSPSSISGVDLSRKFNISTRNSPRKFDTRPYQRMDQSATLVTRKGQYVKLSVNAEANTAKDQQNIDSVPMGNDNMDINSPEGRQQNIQNLEEVVSVDKTNTKSDFITLTNRDDMSIDTGDSISEESTCARTSPKLMTTDHIMKSAGVVSSQLKTKETGEIGSHQANVSLPCIKAEHDKDRDEVTTDESNVSKTMDIKSSLKGLRRRNEGSVSDLSDVCSTDSSEFENGRRKRRSKSTVVATSKEPTCSNDKYVLLTRSKSASKLSEPEDVKASKKPENKAPMNVEAASVSHKVLPPDEKLSNVQIVELKERGDLPSKVQVSVADSSDSMKQINSSQSVLVADREAEKGEKVTVTEDEASKKQHPSGSESRSPEFLAPWPRAQEPMSVKQMFELIRTPPPSTGPGRRKSTGEQNDSMGKKPSGRASLEKEMTPQSASQPEDGKAKIGSLRTRRSGAAVSMSLRTSRPGVDWSTKDV